MMGFQLGLPKALAAEGLRVKLVPNWDTRGSPAFTPYGSVSHWTAGPKTGDHPSLNVCIHGHSSLDGPLCNCFLPRGLTVADQFVWVVAAGRANHAGVGGYRGLVGNSAVFGTEAENSGYDEWTDWQRWAYPRVNAAYMRLARRDSSWVCGHSEWAPTRKIDIHTYDMPRMRREVAAVLAGSTNQEDDMQLTDKLDVGRWVGTTVGQVLDAVMTTTQGIPALTGRIAALEAAVAADPDNPVTQDMLDQAVAAGLAGAHITIETAP